MSLKTAVLGSAAVVLSFTVPTLAADKVPTTVGITVGTLANPFFTPLVAGVKAAVLAANPKGTANTMGADHELAKQSTQIDNFIASGANLIMDA